MRQRDSGGGFTLVEVLVAFAVAALGLATLFQIFAVGLRNADASEAYARAVMYAETRLAAVGIEQELQPGENGGDLDDGYRWRVVVEPYREDDMNAAVEVFAISVTVSWGGQGAAARALTLQTLRLGAEQ
jgi:general secretion pathway protein I